MSEKKWTELVNLLQEAWENAPHARAEEVFFQAKVEAEEMMEAGGNA